jgi:hypothetical protein
VKKVERDSGVRAGVPTDVATRIAILGLVEATPDIAIDGARGRAGSAMNAVVSATNARPDAGKIGHAETRAAAAL